MRVIGRGFVAGHLRTIADRHPAVTVIAAGVSSTDVDSPGAFEREENTVRETLRSVAATGRLVVFLSTASRAMYPDGSGREHPRPHPASAYARHKLRLEDVVRESGVRHVIARLTHLVGDGQRAHQLLPALVAQVRSGEVGLREGARRDLIDVRHVVAILDRLLVTGVADTTVNIGSGVAWPVADVVAGIEARLGVRARHVPAGREVPGPPVSTTALCALVDLHPFRFDATYPNTLLDRYVGPLPARAELRG